MDHLAYTDDAANDVDTRYAWPANGSLSSTSAPLTSDPWSSTSSNLLGVSTVHNSGFTSTADTYLGQCTYPDAWSGYTGPLSGRFTKMIRASWRLTETSRSQSLSRKRACLALTRHFVGVDIYCCSWVLAFLLQRRCFANWSTYDIVSTVSSPRA